MTYNYFVLYQKSATNKALIDQVYFKMKINKYVSLLTNRFKKKINDQAPVSVIH